MIEENRQREIVVEDEEAALDFCEARGLIQFMRIRRKPTADGVKKEVTLDRESLQEEPPGWADWIPGVSAAV